MELYIMLIMSVIVNIGAVYWYQRRAWANIPKPDGGYAIATDVVERTFEAKTEDIEQAVTADEPEEELANIINLKGGPL